MITEIWIYGSWYVRIKCKSSCCPIGFFFCSLWCGGAGNYFLLLKSFDRNTHSITKSPVISSMQDRQRRFVWLEFAPTHELAACEEKKENCRANCTVKLNLELKVDQFRSVMANQLSKAQSVVPLLQSAVMTVR